MDSDVGRRFFRLVTHTLSDLDNINMYEDAQSFTVDFENRRAKDVVLMHPRRTRWIRGTITLDKLYGKVIVNVPVIIADWDRANILALIQFKPYCSGVFGSRGTIAVHESPPPYTNDIGFLYLTNCTPTLEFFKKLAQWYPTAPD